MGAEAASNRPILLLPGEAIEQRRARLDVRIKHDRRRRASRLRSEKSDKNHALNIFHL